MDEKQSPPGRGEPCLKPAPSATRVALLEALQLLALLFWLPFRAVPRVSLWVGLLASRAGNLLVRPIYWAVVQAKRRTQGAPLWQDHDWKIGIGPPCEHCAENVPPTCLPTSYPDQPTQGYGYRNSITLPKPPQRCDPQMGRPSDIGHQFQVRITVHGSLRVRGIYLHATRIERKLYQNLTC